jgi:peptidoglycan/LPS O-acetylase OafA/YrhL
VTGILRSAPARAQTKAGYRPELQGLRALAVTLVVVYHVWFDRVSGGVDVFFLVTGFLLTGQLYRAGASPLGLRRRWGRTLLRLVPSAAVVLAATAVAAFLILPEGRWNQTLREIAASALFAENWQLAADSVDYAARSNTTSVVQHFWSLSIQGQFFLVWPLLVAGVGWWARRTGGDLHARLTATSLVVFGISLAYSVDLTADDQPLAYFHSATRVWEFALGALLALWIDRIVLPAGTRAVVGWVGVVGLVSCGLILTVDDVFPGVVALWPTGCAAAVLVAGRTRLPWAADRLLAGRAARYLGDISYPLYLWHWPVLILYLVAQDQDVAGLRGGLGVIALALVLAVATHHGVEQPLIRRGVDGYRIGSLGTVLVLALAGAWQVAAAVESVPHGVVGDAQHPGAVALTTRGVPQADLLPPPVAVYGDFWSPPPDWTCGPLDALPDQEACSSPAPGGAKRVVIVGDSHAEQFAAAVATIAQRRHWQLTTILRGACPFSTTSDADPNQAGCVDWNAAALAQITAAHPDLVITQASLEVRAGLTERTTPGMVAQWRKVTDLGVPVLAVRDNPRFTFGMPDCVQEHGRDSQRCGVDRADVYAPTPPYAQAPGVPSGVSFLDVADAVCTPVRCPAEIGNVLVYLDDNHLSATYVRSMAPLLEPQIVAAVGH